MLWSVVAFPAFALEAPSDSRLAVDEVPAERGGLSASKFRDVRDRLYRQRHADPRAWNEFRRIYGLEKDGRVRQPPSSPPNERPAASAQ